MTEVLIIQSITLGLLAGALWISGYRLEIPQPDKMTGGGPRSLQFGIKDVLIWTTVMAILLGVMRAADMLRWNRCRPGLRSFYRARWRPDRHRHRLRGMGSTRKRELAGAIWSLDLRTAGTRASLGCFCRYADRHLTLGRFSNGGYDWKPAFLARSRLVVDRLDVPLRRPAGGVADDLPSRRLSAGEATSRLALIVTVIHNYGLSRL